MKKALIQFSDGNITPNLISIIHVKPNRVMHIHTSDTEEPHQAIRDWCQANMEKFGLRPRIKSCRILPGEPAVQSNQLYGILKSEIELAADQGYGAVVIDTAGRSKAMQTAAVELCQDLEHRLQSQGKELRIVIVRTDMAARRIVFETHPEMQEAILGQALNPTKIPARNLIEIAQDTRITNIQAHWQEMYPAACLLRACCPGAETIDLTLENVAKMIYKPLEFQVKKEYRDMIRNFVSHAIQMPDVVAGMALWGFVYRDASFYFCPGLQKLARKTVTLAANKGRTSKRDPRPRRERAFSCLETLKLIQGFLSEGWWEVLVAHAYQTRYPDHEVLWKVETESASARMRTDIIASDGCSLTCISCMRDPQQQGEQGEPHPLPRTLLSSGIVSKHIVAVYGNPQSDELSDSSDGLIVETWTSQTIDDIEQAAYNQGQELSLN